MRSMTETISFVNELPRKLSSDLCFMPRNYYIICSVFFLKMFISSSTSFFLLPFHILPFPFQHDNMPGNMPKGIFYSPDNVSLLSSK